MPEQINVLSNIRSLYRCLSNGGQGDVHALPDAALVWRGTRIIWVGERKNLPLEYATSTAWDGRGRIVVPGLIDCHTHLAFGGWRVEEFVQKVLGVDYLELAAKGGGILATVNHTRAVTEAELISRCKGFLSAIAELGVTTVEAKSGYGLTVDDELKLLRVYQALEKEQPLTIIPTLLAAHAFPPEFSNNRNGYVELICNEIVPQVAAHKLAKFCDVYVEKSVFTIEQAKRVCESATKCGLALKLHADQLSDLGGASFAAQVGAISADHLEFTSDSGINDMAKAGVVSVVLPIASLYLRQPPVKCRKFVAANAPVAVATDFNPGSAPSYHLPLAMMLACTMNGLTPDEALKGATYYAACALGLQNTLGSLEPGKEADFCLIDAEDVCHWLYHFRPNACVMTVKGGRKIFEAIH